MFWFFITEIVTLPPHKLLITLHFISIQKGFVFSNFKIGAEIGHPIGAVASYH